MEVLKEYERIVEMSRKRRNAGTVECKFRPTTEYGETVFGKHIAVNVGKEDRGIFHKLLSFAEAKGLKSVLSEKNYAAAGFNQQIEISEWEALEPGYQAFKTRIMNEFSRGYGLHLNSFTIELGEFIPHPQVEELDFDDIPDLREGVK